MAANSAGYSGTPLAKKLGIKPGHAVALLNEPDGFRDWLETHEARLRKSVGRNPDIVVAFTTRRRILERRIDAGSEAIFPDGALWVAWPKKASKVPTDITEDVVRELALPLGLVDNKVCAISDVWSGLRLVWRRTERTRNR